MSFLEFSKSVVTSLLLEKDDAESSTADENTMRLTQRHFPEKIAPLG